MKCHFLCYICLTIQITSTAQQAHSYSSDQDRRLHSLTPNKDNDTTHTSVDNSNTQIQYEYLYEYNVSSVLEQYIAVCGHDYLCDTDNIPSVYKSNTSYKKLIFCPVCSCLPSCLERGNCCPDRFLRYPPLSCSNISIMEQKEFLPPKRYLLVDKCPRNSSPELILKCSENRLTLERKLRLPPVTSRGRYPMTYKNKYCAQCNGIKTFDNWMLDFNCMYFTDFNYLSSYEVIIQTAKQKTCQITFKPLNKEDGKRCSITEVSALTKEIDSCNTTGIWRKHDEDVSTLCRSRLSTTHTLYGDETTSFKNIFCYICNPPFYDNEIIEECNTTGMWQSYDFSVVKSCKLYPQMEATYPFKNIFCNICNRNTSHHRLYMDSSITFQAPMEFCQARKCYSLLSDSLNTEYFFRTAPVPNLPDNSYAEFDIYNEFESMHNINLTNLFRKSFADASRAFCETKWLPQTILPLQEQCVCESLRCKLNCCFDLSIVYPRACYTMRNNFKLLSDKKDEFMLTLIDGCFGSDVPNLMKMYEPFCNGKIVSDTIFSYIPVSNDGIKYRNTFCAICNSVDYNSSLINTTENGKTTTAKTFFNKVDFMKEKYTSAIVKALRHTIAFKIKIECPIFITLSNHVFLYSVLLHAQKIECNTTFRPYEMNLMHFSDNECKQNDIKNCNTSGHWPEIDKDIQWACENNTVDKEEFCSLCNPPSFVGDIIESCDLNKTSIQGDWRIVDACEQLPRIYSNRYLPFKNRYCQLCNVLQNRGSVIINVKDNINVLPARINNRDDFIVIHHIRNRGSLRSLFSLAEYEPPKFIKIKECYDNQIYDKQQNVCRNITCYPGKFVNGSSCFSLLTVTNNLRYILRFKSKGKLLVDSKVQYILQEYKFSLITAIAHVIKTKQFQVEGFYVLVNHSCVQESDSGFKDLEFLVYMKMFIYGHVPRLESELNLIYFMDNILNVSIGNETFLMQNSYSIHSVNVPTRIQGHNVETSCFDIYKNESSEDYRTVHIAPFLVCRHTEFEKYEYRMDWERQTILLVNINLKLLYDEFHIMENGKVMVCLDRVEENLLSDHNTSYYMSSLDLLTTICLAISILCLLVTLITYCLFQPLRTLPGKNNICLCSSLLCAQILMLIIPRVSHLHEICIVIGALSHFSWLSYFGSLSMCSFHMFLVFSGRFNRSDSAASANRTVAKYCLVFFGIPVVIVAVVVIVSLSSSSGKSSGYSSFRCFIEEKNVFIITLLTPLVLICVTNMFFFAFTAYKIKTSPKVQKNQPERLQFVIYCKLFVLTGLTWTIQIIDTFLLVSFLSYLSVIFNCTQGLLLAVSYVFNKRVYTMYKQLCGREKKSPDSSSSGNNALLKNLSASNTQSTTV